MILVVTVGKGSMQFSSTMKSLRILKAHDSTNYGKKQYSSVACIIMNIENKSRFFTCKLVVTGNKNYFLFLITNFLTSINQYIFTNAGTKLYHLAESIFLPFSIVPFVLSISIIYGFTSPCTKRY
jgi:hypothetical protein